MANRCLACGILSLGRRRASMVSNLTVIRDAGKWAPVKQGTLIAQPDKAPAPDGPIRGRAGLRTRKTRAPPSGNGEESHIFNILHGTSSSRLHPRHSRFRGDDGNSLSPARVA